MSSFLARLTAARQRARTLVTESHVSTDIQEVVQDLLNCTQELERQLGSAEGQSGDLRVLKSRNEALSSEVRKKENDLNAFKKKFLDLVIAEIRNITSETAKISAATQADQEGAAFKGSKAINQSLRALVEALTKE